MKKALRFDIFFVSLLSIIFSYSVSYADSQIRAVGSSTVYPFVTVAAEQFGKSSKFKTPIVESIGTGGGFKLFCSGVGEGYPDISNASRAIKKSEVNLCKENGIEIVTEIKLGYDGIVLANVNGAKKYSLTKKQIFLALAREVPKNGKLVKNFYKKWSDVDPSLPAEDIEVYGPPPTSGTRDAFVELVLEGECVDLPEFKSTYADKNDRKKTCHLIREDGVFIEAGENDNLIIQKLKSNDKALGLFGYSSLEQNESVVQGSKIEGVAPTFDNIADGKYAISRPLFVYFKDSHLALKPGLGEFIKELVSENAIGDDGYLTFKGLIPLNEEERQNMQKPILEKISDG